MGGTLAPGRSHTSRRDSLSWQVKILEGDMYLGTISMWVMLGARRWREVTGVSVEEGDTRQSQGPPGVKSSGRTEQRPMARSCLLFPSYA